MTPVERERLCQFYDLFVSTWRYFGATGPLPGSDGEDVFDDAFGSLYGEEPGHRAGFGTRQHLEDLLAAVEETRHAFANWRTGALGSSCQSITPDKDADKCPCLEHACLRTEVYLRGKLS